VTAEILKTFAALIGILGLILLMAWGFRRMGFARGTFDKGADGWRVLGVKALSPGKQIYIVEVGRRTLLIGATDKMLTSLMEISDKEDREMIHIAVAGSKPQMPNFMDFLRKAQK
jgi:flagellar biogenesis protein FliO